MHIERYGKVGAPVTANHAGQARLVGIRSRIVARKRMGIECDLFFVADLDFLRMVRNDLRQCFFSDVPEHPMLLMPSRSFVAAIVIRKMDAHVIDSTRPSSI